MISTLSSRRFLFFSSPQAYADSDVDLFTWGTPITTLALLTILVHLGIETKTWVRNLNFRLIDGKTHRFLHLKMPHLSLKESFFTQISKLAS